MSNVDMGNVSKTQTGDSSGRLSRAEAASPSRAVSGQSGSESARGAPSDMSCPSLLPKSRRLKVNSGLSGVDQDRVDSIRQSISDGSYTVDADKVIDELLRGKSLR